MTSLSALEAISPAIQRTKFYLFKPFRLGRFLKLALVASLVEGSYSGFNFNFPFPGRSEKLPPMHVPSIHWPSPSVWIAVAAIVILIAVPLSLVVGYLLIRLRFSYFDCVLAGKDEIAPGWRKYHRQALSYLWMSLGISLAFVLLTGVIALVVWSRNKEVFAGIARGEQVDFLSLIPSFLIAIFVLSLMGILAYVVQTAMSYFVLPRMALEDAHLREAFEDVWADMKAEPGQFALFLLMRILLPMAASVIAFLLMLVPVLVLALIGVILAAIVHAMAGSGSSPTFWVLGILGGLVAAIVLVVIGISFGGTVGTFTRNYGMLFYAGRYDELARRLWPDPPGMPELPMPPGGFAPPPFAV